MQLLHSKAIDVLRRHMMKTYSTITLVVIVLALTACQSAASPPPAATLTPVLSTSTPPPTSTPAPTATIASTPTAVPTITPVPTAAPAISDPKKTLVVMDKYGLKMRVFTDSKRDYKLYESPSKGTPTNAINVELYDDGNVRLYASGDTLAELENQSETLKKIMVELYGSEFTQQAYVDLKAVKDIRVASGTFRQGGHEIEITYKNPSWNWFFMAFKVS
jgi:hypothetical protein